MITRIIFGILLFFYLSGCDNTNQDKSNDIKSGELAVVDDLGDTLYFNQPPAKIVTLAPNLTEIIYALGAGDRLVGNTKFCNYPPEAVDIQNVGDLLTVNYELISAIKPDLIFITIEGNKKEVYDRLKQLGNKVFISNPRDYEGIKKTLSDIALITGKTHIADSLIKVWDQDVEKCRSANFYKNSLNVMFMVSANPVMLAGENTFVNEYLKMLGLKNIAVGVPMNYPLFSREKIYDIDPDFIFYPGMEKNVKENVVGLYPEWRELRVFREDNFITLDPDLFYRPGPRFTEALKELKNVIDRRL
ncbi:MAG: ABC transporter substrate-binding protein [Melioribacteraceae bacterium]|nr:MAG: ABC transporter substrate-binding protein [Melioribacteraceae bacterium]